MLDGALNRGRLWGGAFWGGWMSVGVGVWGGVGGVGGGGGGRGKKRLLLAVLSACKGLKRTGGWQMSRPQSHDSTS